MRFLPGLMLAIALVNLTPALAKEPTKVVASAALQKEFDDFIAKFRAALKANDATAVAGMSRLPFMNDKAIGDAAQFRAKIYTQSFTARTRACLQRSKAAYDRDDEKNDYYSITCDDDMYIFTKTPAGFLFTDIGAND